MGNPENNNNELLREIGKIAGKLDALDQGLAQRIGDLRDDMLRIHREQSEAIARLRFEVRQMIVDSEARTDKRIDDLNRRVGKLEDAEKMMIQKIAGTSALGGGAGMALVAGGIELLKRIF